MGSAQATTTKEQALKEFEKWALTYDRSVLQHLLFRPTFQVLLEEVTRWRKSMSVAGAAPFRVLDVGCGTGVWPALLRRSAFAPEVTGLDFSPEMCRRAHRRAEELGLGGLSFVNADSEFLPFADNTFDLITCTHSFHHYPQQAAVVRDMKRVLRPGGRLMLCDGFKDNVVGWFVFDVCVTRVEGDVYHVGWREMLELFAQAGFENVRQRKFNILAPALLTIGCVPNADSDATPAGRSSFVVG